MRKRFQIMIALMLVISGCDFFTADYLKAFDLDTDVRSIAFSKDGSMLMAGGGRSKIWRVADWQEIYDSGPRKTTSAVLFSPDSRSALVCDINDSSSWIRLLAIDPGGITKVVSLREPCRYLSISNDSRYVAHAKISLLKILTMSNLHTVDSVAEDTDVAQFAPDGSLLAVRYSNDRKSASFYRYELSDTGLLQEVSVVDYGDGCFATEISFSPDGKVFMMGNSHNFTIPADLWSYPEFEPLWKLAEPVEHVAFAPHGEWIALGSMLFGVRLVNALDGSLIVEIEGPHNSPMPVAVSPDGKYLASGHGSWVRIRDVSAIRGQKF
ncbi:MAG: WD40 repeat domain-containing protein [Deltaproteobacteria bacterium]|nr:WD40 repeat domain-containing protein [Deltaproteobacteria bacterium]